eukprot:g13033.t1
MSKDPRYDSRNMMVPPRDERDVQSAEATETDLEKPLTGSEELEEVQFDIPEELEGPAERVRVEIDVVDGRSKTWPSRFNM